MKKHLLIGVTSAILLTGILLSSCISSGNAPVGGGVKGGLIIYSAVDLQTVITKDPLYVALKFNSLLATVAKQKEDNPTADITIHNVEIFPITDKDNKKANYKNYLFGAATIDEQDPGVWKITFVVKSVGFNDNERSGYIIIDTKGKMLSELDPLTESWNITTGEGANAYNILFGTRGRFRCAIENYKIVRNALPGYWTASGKSLADDFDMIGDGEQADWTFNISLSQTPAVGGISLDVKQDYENAVNDDYTLTTYSSGKPAYNDFPIEYLGADMLYQPKCGRLPFAGEETVTLTDMGSLDPEVFPENFVTLRWKRYKTDCIAYYELTYNGHVFSSLTGSEL